MLNYAKERDFWQLSHNRWSPSPCQSRVMKIVSPGLEYYNTDSYSPFENILFVQIFYITFIFLLVSAKFGHRSGCLVELPPPNWPDWREVSEVDEYHLPGGVRGWFIIVWGAALAWVWIWNGLSDIDLIVSLYGAFRKYSGRLTLCTFCYVTALF